MYYRCSSFHLQFFLSIQDLVSHSALHTVPWHDELRDKYIKLNKYIFYFNEQLSEPERALNVLKW